MAGFFGFVLRTEQTYVFVVMQEEKFLISQYDTLNWIEKAINVAKMFAN